MNRIILIGNGFDLAHGLPTSYNSFICSFWEYFLVKVEEYRCNKLDNEYITFETDMYDLAYITSGMPCLSSEYSINKLEEQIKRFKGSMGTGAKVNLVFKNKFLETISRHSGAKNWVDIEDAYYKFLYSFIDRKEGADYFYQDIKKLNEDFCKIKNELETYLTRIISDNKIEPDRNIESIVYSKFRIKDFTDIGVQDFAEKEYFKIENYGQCDPNEIQISTKTIKQIGELKNYTLHELKNSLIDEYFVNKCFDFVPNEILFLNFNYTNLENLYTNNDSEIIHIHGELNSKNNPIIFGYGDEIGKEYAEIENLIDNEFLENIKSIRYLDTDNYKRLLSFINSDKYQIFVFGHSCGNSDRTLLNTLFENENCVSIKPFYYKRENGTDNYSDITRNISRNFSIKSLMREKVVNKMYCEPLIGKIKTELM